MLPFTMPKFPGTLVQVAGAGVSHTSAPAQAGLVSSTQKVEGVVVP